ncbi:MAG: hypothetical protein ACFFA0_10365 [Promethearchaeota archaeon]
MREKRIHVINDEIKSIGIITCPVCGFTFRMVEMKTKKRNKNCPLCGTRLFYLEINKILF